MYKLTICLCLFLFALVGCDLGPSGSSAPASSNEVACGQCDGQGYTTPCWNCHGSTKMRSTMKAGSCYYCNGTGKDGKCNWCGGRGTRSR